MGSMLFEAAGPAALLRGAKRLRRPKPCSRAPGLYRGRRADYRDQHVRREPLEAGAAGAGRSRGRRSIIAASKSRAKRAKPLPHEVLIAGSIGPLGIGAGHVANRRAKRSSKFIANRRWRWKSAAWISLFWRPSRTWTCCWRRSTRFARFLHCRSWRNLRFPKKASRWVASAPRKPRRALAQKNVQAIGANCTLGPQSLLPILEVWPRPGVRFRPCPTPDFPSASATAPSIRDLRRNILRCLRAKPRPSARASWAAAAAPRPNTFARWPKR